MKRRFFSLGLCIGLAPLALACQTNVGLLGITLVRSWSSDQDPFKEVYYVRVRVETPGELLATGIFPLRDRSWTLEKVPTGEDRRVTVEGLDPEKNVVSRGRTAPLEITDGDNAISLFVGLINQFSFTPTRPAVKQPGRAFLTATLMGDGRVLVSGGTPANWRPETAAANPTPSRVAEILDGSSLASTLSDCAELASAPGCMRQARVGHTATLLQSGNVLLAGGLTGTGSGTPGDGLFDQGHQDAARDAGVPRPYQGGDGGAAEMGLDAPAGDPGADAPLPDHGGDGPVPDRGPEARVPDRGPEALPPDQGVDAGAGMTSSLELFQYEERHFFNVGTLVTPRAWHRAVLISGTGVVFLGGMSQSGGATWSAELYGDGGVKEFSDMSEPRRAHTLTLLKDGSLLVAGGLNRSSQPISTLERWQGTWSIEQQSLKSPRAYHTATLLQDGRVLFVGGLTTLGPVMEQVARTIEIFDPAGGKVEEITDFKLQYAPWAHTATLLQSGKVLVVGGFSGRREGDPLRQVVLLTISHSSVRQESLGFGLSRPRGGHAAVLLASGMVLVTGGLSNEVVSGKTVIRPTATSEVFVY